MPRNRLRRFIPKPVVADKLLEAIARCLKLEWIYEGPAGAQRVAPATSSEFEIEHRPGPIASALLEAARKGHARGIMEHAQALEALGDPYVAYARRLRELGKQFRFEEICAIAEEHARADSPRASRIGISKSPFSSGAKIRLNLSGVKHAQSQSGNGELLGYSSAPGAKFGDILASWVDEDQGRGPAQGAEPNGGGVLV